MLPPALVSTVTSRLRLLSSAGEVESGVKLNRARFDRNAWEGQVSRNRCRSDNSLFRRTRWTSPHTAGVGRYVRYS